MIAPALLLWMGAAHARPEAPEVFCERYPEAPACSTGSVACTTCHSLSGPPAKNPFGSDVDSALSSLTDLAETGDFVAWLPEALAGVEELDSDEDGATNLAEILAGTEPGWDSSTEPECASQVEVGNDLYAVGTFDPAFAWRRVMLDFCGRSPRYEEWASFRALAQPDAMVQTTLDLCLQSPYWDEVLEELAVGVVEPIGPATDVNILGNWEWDLRLWEYAMSGDRDAADVMLADYLVIESPAGSGHLETIEDPRFALEEYAQPLAAEDRYGIITTRYSLAMRVMFSEVPRTLAAHWMRKLLGLDIARSEGLFPVDESDGAYGWDAPADVDGKGVWQESCAACHTTLDPLSYPWARYNGIDLEGDTTGRMLPDRATDLLPTTDGWILGEAVAGPEEWVLVAAESDAFAEQTTRIFWRQVFHRDPYSCEEDEFEALWIGFKEEGRNVESMLRDLVATSAYGTP